jgi:predicted DNA-binding ribbon-helix-helix protein
MLVKHYPHKPAWYDDLKSLDEDDGELVIRQGVIDGHRTSFRLYNLTWKALAEVAERESLTLNDLYTRIKRNAPGGLNFTTALRHYLLAYFREAATERGHVNGGHGSRQRKGRISPANSPSPAALPMPLSRGRV